MEFNPPITVEKVLDDEETTPLDGETATPDEEGDAAKAAEGSDCGEDPDV